MKKVFLVITTLFLIVTISKAGQPIDKIEVVLEKVQGNESVKNIITNKKGRFVFSKIPKGSYVIKVLMEENKDFLKVVKSSNKMYEKYSKSIRAGYKQKRKKLIYRSVAGCNLVKFSKTKNLDNEHIKPLSEDEFFGSKEFVPVYHFEVSDGKGKIKGKIEDYSLRKFLKKVGKKGFPPLN